MGNGIEAQLEPLCEQNSLVRELIQDKLEKRQHGFVLTRDELEKINFQLTAMEVMLRSMGMRVKQFDDTSASVLRGIDAHLDLRRFTQGLIESSDYENDPRLADVKMALRTVDSAYVTYRQTNKLEDSPVVKLAYYLHVAKENEKNPYSDEDVQYVVGKHIQRRVKEASDEADRFFNKIVENQGPPAERP